MQSFVASHKGTHRQGEFDFYRGRLGGEVAVYYDSKLIRYKLTRLDKMALSDFKHWLVDVYTGFGDTVKISGRFPTYYLD